MRFFFTRREPDAARILLVESGSRFLLEGLIGGIYTTYGRHAAVDLVTCYPGLPRGFRESTRVYRVTGYRGARSRLIAELLANRYTILGIICSAEPIMTKWKWLLAARLPVKVFILNENGDYFWFDRAHFSAIRHFVLFRAGLAGAGAVHTIGRLLLFPFTLSYLLLYAAAVHARRRIRRLAP
ncbi:MAG: hypothetical protein ACRD8O_05765 [Bryobacteraceae bacterium]